ncbi:uncharacterized protein LACBIDRAFT_327096 [Laccaria bicolor S238N-H82]|uniref:Predicted protein n=1 Tax=Laccaria bicolor (strain S238N-H82 / ATCC MYA-4686) TaxID=486041 RepID=B0DAM6_LACBS|nr:uncharacterized protein LACBIDRAFT_327096 [Laccaria bicolor S238N-H82]EDR08775.1 predicted protein [Laccaria bicolor S238N-H82]|eukprot:XP_001881000.1 predicted protein [Laccaria bicolor S238N-H82]
MRSDQAESQYPSKVNSIIRIGIIGLIIANYQIRYWFSPYPPSHCYSQAFCYLCCNLAYMPYSSTIQVQIIHYCIGLRKFKGTSFFLNLFCVIRRLISCSPDVGPVLAFYGSPQQQQLADNATVCDGVHHGTVVPAVVVFPHERRAFIAFTAYGRQDGLVLESVRVHIFDVGLTSSPRTYAFAPSLPLPTASLHLKFIPTVGVTGLLVIERSAHIPHDNSRTQHCYTLKNLVRHTAPWKTIAL